MTPAEPQITSTMSQDPDNEWWLDDHLWLDLLEWLFWEDSSKADIAAKLWHHLIVELSSGPEGVTHVISSLENALRLTFPFTETYHACRTLYRISLSEEFPANQQALALLTEAMKRRNDALLAAGEGATPETSTPPRGRDDPHILPS
jgi:hypothetical protein